MMTKKLHQNKSGQVALVVLLVSAVVLTLGLSISRKTVVETRIDTDEELLRQAFNTAESGIEYYLSTGGKDYMSGDDSKAVITTSKIGQSDPFLDFDEITEKNKNTAFWLSSHDEDGKIQIMEGHHYGADFVNLCVDVGFTGAVKVDYYYHQSNAYKVKRMGYNVNNNNFVVGYQNLTLSEAPTSSCNGRSGMRLIQNIDLTIIGPTRRNLMVAVTPLGGNSKLVLGRRTGSSATFPSQGEEIISTGSVPSTRSSESGSVTSRVRVYNKYRIPSFMLDAVTSLGNIN